MKKIVVILICCGIIFTSCGPKNIPGTDVPDTEENRAVLTVFKEYVSAVQSKDAEKILSLVSPDFYDSNGTDRGDDDVDFNNLKAFLMSEEFKQILKIDLIFIIKEMSVKNDTAKILFYYETRFKQEDKEDKRRSLLNQTNEKWTKSNDVNMMIMKKVNGTWKIVSGI